MLLQKKTDTRGVGISNMRKSIYLLTTTPKMGVVSRRWMWVESMGVVRRRWVVWLAGDGCG